MPDSERNEIVLVATGADRPGVLDDVSAFLHERQATILESRVSLLRGSFALLLLVRADESAVAKITRDLPELQDSARLHAELRPGAADATPPEITALRL